MFNKSTILQDTKKGVITPESTKNALDNLPFNYINKVIEELAASNKVYSKSYIVRVRKGTAYNEGIMTALVNVGNNEIEKRKQFGRLK